ncbi:MAG: phenylalanine--tRNA ligase subunit alpha [Calditrichaeota bacterium]|nr:MAG: phenylalanine--tRNA ligase subunit alpha [Calditrichota bacterium]
MKEEIKSVQLQLEEDLQSVADEKALKELRIRFLGRKGLITNLFRKLGEVPKEERPLFGKMLNELRQRAEDAISEKRSRFGEKAPTDWIDLTLPGRKPIVARKHPLTQVREEIKQIFAQMGFSVAEGPEVETDYYNFEALNIPKLHPARDMQDTLYISEELVLRTHTSPVQIRTMEKQKPPIRIIAPGRVYRRDTPDASHSPFFHQVEGLCVDKNISLGDLKAVLSVFAQKMFGQDARVRFRPSFFPFTEPSAEMDLWWQTPKGGEWLEIMGCGMVHPNVLEGVGIDSRVYSGYAFGMGIDRIAMLKFGITDIRLLYDNDMRFLQQF